MKRREVIALVGGAAVWPLAVHAQQPDRVRRVGVLMAYSQDDVEARSYVSAFRDALKEFGSAGSRVAIFQ
jgi:putative tryptophan/tyrosine transport system substrate-binding protein